MKSTTEYSQRITDSAPLWRPGRRVPVSVIIMTLNEEENLPGAIQSVKGWAEDLFMVDSCSTDRSVDIAIEHGVGIVQRPFTNYGDQWNWALERLPIKTPWVLKLDADERVSAELKEEIEAVLSNELEEHAFVIPVRVWFMGKPMHPKIHVVRLWRTGTCRFSDVIVNEHPIVNGPIGKLKGIFEHFDSPNLHHWYDKQNRYTTMEAIMRVKGESPAAEPKLFGNRLKRRMLFKKLFFCVPFRYQLQWLHEVIVRGAWRDGSVGLAWARLRIELRRSIELKVKEMRATGNIPELPRPARGDFDSRVLSSSLQKFVAIEGKENHSRIKEP